MAAIVIKASGIVRAAAYMAKMADASAGGAQAGSTSSGLISPATEKPLATTTLSAVRTQARPMLSANRGAASIANALIRVMTDTESAPVRDAMVRPPAALERAVCGYRSFDASRAPPIYVVAIRP